MADQTGIQWCDATMNPWIGCEKVSPGCAYCYAMEWATGWPGTFAGTWGADGVRRRTSPAKWREPLRWARLAREGLLPNGEPNLDGHRPRIFCASLADVFENRPELGPWREDLFALICATPELDWLVLTKRPEHARDWLGASAAAYANVWLGTSIENARHTYRADVLREIPAAVRFISAEPLLGSLYPPGQKEHVHHGPLDLTGIDWVIVGGESGPGARPFHLEHAREIVRAAACPDCGGRGWTTEPGPDPFLPNQIACDPRGSTAVFVKQLGARPLIRATGRTHDGVEIAFDKVPFTLRDRKGGDWSEWPADLRIREFPTTTKEASAA